MTEAALKKAQQFADEYLHDGRKVVEIQRTLHPLEAILVMDSGKPVTVTGLFAVKMLTDTPTQSPMLPEVP